MLNNILAGVILFLLIVAFSQTQEGFSSQYYDFLKHVPFWNYRHPYDTKQDAYYEYPYDESVYYDYPPYFDRYRDNYPYYETSYRTPPL